MSQIVLKMSSSPICLPQGACNCKKTVAFSFGKQYLESGNFHQKIQARTCVWNGLYSVNPQSEGSGWGKSW
ncbi:hypothetical protein [Pokkaliibacter plantistimulans]|uniref:hypothetical protein n=1 Tax=Pokkaliibacter plantistimulans TaxID=1635171 RepID=UPI0010583AB3|nr:hypothetical protein [Pokkaliibacter plantistimulans]